MVEFHNLTPPGFIIDLLHFLKNLRHHARYPTVIEGTIIGVLGYLALTRLLRWRRYNAIHREYMKKYQDGTLTPEEAQRIILVSTSYDMPLLLNYSLAFALFKTYAIVRTTFSLHLRALTMASLSAIDIKLLSVTGEFKSAETVSIERYTDTEILIATWVACPISGFLDPNFKSSENGPPADDPRAMIALARVNWIHSRYRIRWAERYGWRKLSPMECEAFYVFWAEIGRRMNMRDIPESREEMIEWSRDYEVKNMIPAETNKEVAEYTMAELLSAVPTRFGLRSFAVTRVALCLLEDRVRVGMMQPAQPWIYPSFPVKIDLPKPTGERCPKLHPNKWQYRPWYRPESTGLGYLQNKFLVAIGWYSEMPGPHLKSSGYRLEEMGPFKFEDSAHEEVMQKAAELQGCPVAGRKDVVVMSLPLEHQRHCRFLWTTVD
ncbi:uncharacterized protein LACBIDRAFT_318452 [Laccaria bicolor S238N-H82]|uniref:Predicted protein n=1 Tax=Laccaria bicolor (strain S238N-H82 / ATCC MYA-4686) TaxID=486041 RepID=B0E2H5_LACBS|nr:uncharacterized protein LACBIDRAFT_318452 [Laccaria bicolor S238N-H82]EDQ98946.1 predicted protein [Laccaria bicolor S238N-H82]|eukprot:XP_001890397.1 predicted protein [Laccaria bicolor S238N-H82]